MLEINNLNKNSTTINIIFNLLLNHCYTYLILKEKEINNRIENYNLVVDEKLSNMKGLEKELEILKLKKNSQSKIKKENNIANLKKEINNIELLLEKEIINQDKIILYLLKYCYLNKTKLRINKKIYFFW